MQILNIFHDVGTSKTMLPLDLPYAPVSDGRRDRFNNQTPLTRALTRGICRLFTDMGFGAVTEFRLPNGRRVDVMALGSGGEFSVIEVKSSVPDFRSDAKWPEYLPFCDRFYFAVPEHFPVDILPDDCGIIVADSFAAIIEREAPERALNATRRRHQLQRFALTASERLQRLTDPRP
ncbi:MAG: MmcB family DNA repair protein [Alphaproteobacteria bacterium]